MIYEIKPIKPKAYLTLNWYDYKENEKEIQEQLIYEYGYAWIQVRFISWEVW